MNLFRKSTELVKEVGVKWGIFWSTLGGDKKEFEYLKAYGEMEELFRQCGCKEGWVIGRKVGLEICAAS